MSRVLNVGGFTFADPGVLDGDGNRLTLMTLDGWDDSGSGVRLSKTDRPSNHGAFSEAGLRTGRSVAFSGVVEGLSSAAAAIVKRQLAALLADGSSGDITVTDPDELTLTSTVQLAAKPSIGWSGKAKVECAFELWAPDSLLYADPVSYPTGFAAATGGLKFPLFTDGTDPVGFLDFSAPSSLGRVTLTNTGTAEARPQFAVAGPVPVEGFDVVCMETGERLTYVGAILAGSTVVLDSATGRVLLDGVSDRSGNLTVAQWFGVPPGASRTILFLPRGALSAATMTATVRCPSW